jgi:hypothetical protein
MYKLLFYFGFLACFSASAQSISPFTINVGGATVKTLDYSIGESASITYFQNSNQLSLSTGFIQSFTPLVTGIINKVFEEGEGLTLSPNPASERIHLKGVLSRPGFFEFHLIDAQGRILETYESTYYINYLDKEINVTQLMGGTYFIRLIYSSPDGVNQSTSFKFSRIN